MSEILSREDFEEFAYNSYPTSRGPLLAHDAALRARIAELEAERDGYREAQENAWRNVNLLTTELGKERADLQAQLAAALQRLGAVEKERQEAWNNWQMVLDDYRDAKSRLAAALQRAEAAEMQVDELGALSDFNGR